MNQLKTFILLAALTALFGAVGYMLGGAAGMLIALVVAAGLNAVGYWNADRAVLAMYQAEDVDEHHPDPRIRTYAIDVAALAHRAELPRPRICIIHQDQPNAFATGRDPAHAAVCATTGLLSLMTREEVRGVMAHELAHVKNRDTLIMTVTATLAGAIGMLGNFAMLMGGSNDRDRPGGMIGTLAMMILAPITAALVQMAISRSREYEADRMGSELSGEPTALASALRRIEDFTQGGLTNHDAERNPATAHMFIINPLNGGGMDNLFSTHPSTENRVKQLMTLAGRDTMLERPLPKTAVPTNNRNRRLDWR